jgi:hypothetical protein
MKKKMDGLLACRLEQGQSSQCEDDHIARCLKLTEPAATSTSVVTLAFISRRGRDTAYGRYGGRSLSFFFVISRMKQIVGEIKS